MKFKTFAGLIREWSKEMLEGMKDAGIILSFVKSKWICGYGAPSGKNYD